MQFCTFLIFIYRFLVRENDEKIAKFIKFKIKYSVIFVSKLKYSIFVCKRKSYSIENGNAHRTVFTTIHQQLCIVVTHNPHTHTQRYWYSSFSAPSCYFVLHLLKLWCQPFVYIMKIWTTNWTKCEEFLNIFVDLEISLVPYIYSFYKKHKYNTHSRSIKYYIYARLLSMNESNACLFYMRHLV